MSHKRASIASSNAFRLSGLSFVITAIDPSYSSRTRSSCSSIRVLLSEPASPDQHIAGLVTQVAWWGRGSGGVEELLEAVARVGAEADLLEDTDADVVTLRRAHDLLEVLVLERHRVELVDLPRFAADGQLALPQPVAPLGMHVADALHAEAVQRVEFDVLATTVGVHQPDARVPGATRPGQVADVVVDRGEHLDAGVLGAGDRVGVVVHREHRAIGVPLVPVLIF